MLARATAYRELADANDENCYLRILQQRGAIDDMVHLLRPVFSADVRCEAAAALRAFALSYRIRTTRDSYDHERRKRPKPPSFAEAAFRAGAVAPLVAMLDDAATREAVDAIDALISCSEADAERAWRTELLAVPHRVPTLVAMIGQGADSRLAEQATGVLCGLLSHPGRVALNMDKDGSVRAAQAQEDRRQLRATLVRMGGVGVLLDLLRAALATHRDGPPLAAARAASVLAGLTWNARGDALVCELDAREMISNQGGVALLLEWMRDCPNDCPADNVLARQAEHALVGLVCWNEKGVDTTLDAAAALGVPLEPTSPVEGEVYTPMCQVAKTALQRAEKDGGRDEDTIALLERAVGRVRKLEVRDSDATKQRRRDEGDDWGAYDSNHEYWATYVDSEMLERCERRLAELRRMQAEETKQEMALATIREHCARLGTSLSDDESSICPLTFERLRDPVVASDGHSYERRALESYLAQKAEAGEEVKSPLTREILSSTVYPNHALRKQLRAHHADVRAALATRPDALMRAAVPDLPAEPAEALAEASAPKSPPQAPPQAAGVAAATRASTSKRQRR